MAIEDIIWAKNRHMFGGMEPDEVKTYQALCNGSVGDTHTILINIEIPEDTVIDSHSRTQVICSVSGVVVRGSFEDYPKDEFSGILIGDYTKTGPYTAEITGESGQTLYLSAFTYSDQGVFNRNAAQRSVVLDSSYYVYGYDLDTSDEEPSTRVSYPVDVHNFGWTPATLNDLGTNWGAIEPGTKFMPRPCMLKRDGSLGEYLNPDNYKETIDGETSNVTNSSYDGDAMMEWPKIYTKRWEENGIYHFRCSDVKIDDDYECWCNYFGTSETPSDNFYTGIYLSSFDDAKAGSSTNRSRSLSGLPSGFDHYSGVYDYIRPDGNINWFGEHVSEHLLILDLLTMMGQTTNLRTVYGCTGDLPASYTGSKLRSGVYDNKGLFFGDELYSKVFGMEYYFILDGTARHIFGIKSKSNAWQINETPYGSSASIKSVPVATNSEGYYVEGYISDMTCNSFGRLPYNTNDKASLTTYECSGIGYSNFYQNRMVGYIALAYGFASLGSNAGAPHRLSYRPSPTT